VERKSWRRSLYVIAAVLAVLASGPMLPVELAVWFSGELVLYLEVVSGVWLSSRVTSWRSLMSHPRARAAQVMRYLKADWARSHPSVASWVQWTFASI
jgi:hypothetical protein